MTIATETIIVASPRAMLIIAILTIGREKLPLVFDKIRLAINNSKFNFDNFVYCKAIKKNENLMKLLNCY